MGIDKYSIEYYDPAEDAGIDFDEELAYLRGQGPETKARKMPKQKPGKSEQSVATPPEFMAAVERRFGKMQVDLAADAENTKAPQFITQEQDSLKQDWSTYSGNLWLNPPYADIEPWVKKCCETNLSKGGYRKTILVLIPASVGSNYFKNWIFDKCRVYFLSPRIKFIGHKHPYPKDLMLCVYDDLMTPSCECWRWDE